MKRDRGIDHARTSFKPGLNFCACEICGPLAERARAGEDVGVAHGEIPPECKYLNREEVFAAGWETMNDPAKADRLTVLFHTRQRLDLDAPDEQLLLFNDDPSPTRRERAVAATVLQWLGTNVGWCFLEETLEECGFVIHGAAEFEGLVQVLAATQVAEAQQRAVREIKEATARADAWLKGARAALATKEASMDQLIADGIAEERVKAEDATRDMITMHRLKEKAERRLAAHAAVAFGRFENLEDEDEL